MMVYIVPNIKMCEKELFDMVRGGKHLLFQEILITRTC